jgi:hypothetical protein
MICRKRENGRPLYALRVFLGGRQAAVLCIILAFIVCTLPVLGQTLISGDIDGLVTDSTGAVIPNATVKATAVHTGALTITKTTDAGVFHIPLLKPGEYTITVSSPGFKTSTASILVGLGKVARANFKMEVGANTQTVHVTEAAPMLDTENGQITTTFDEKQV